MTSKTRRTIGSFAALAAATALAGCSFINPIQTQELVALSDGVQVWVDPGLRADNITVLTSAEGETGVVIGTLANDTDEAAEFTLSIADGGITTEVGAGEVVQFTEENPVFIPQVPVAPGQFIEAELSVAGHGSETALVPVLDDTLSHFADHMP